VSADDQVAVGQGADGLEGDVVGVGELDQAAIAERRVARAVGEEADDGAVGADGGEGAAGQRGGVKGDVVRTGVQGKVGQGMAVGAEGGVERDADGLGREQDARLQGKTGAGFGAPVRTARLMHRHARPARDLPPPEKLPSVAGPPPKESLRGRRRFRRREGIKSGRCV
jgi:hypothetical protein